MLAGAQRLANLFERDLGPLQLGQPSPAEPSEAARLGPGGGGTDPDRPTVLGQIAWVEWPSLARDLWGLWWQEKAGAAPDLTKLLAADAPQPGVSVSEAGDQPLGSLVRGAVDFWLEQALVRASLEPVTDLTANLLQDRSRYEAGLQDGPDETAWLGSAGRLTGLFLDDWLRRGTGGDDPAAPPAMTLASLFRYLRLHPDQSTVSLPEPAGLAQAIAEATGRDASGLVSAHVQSGLPLPLDTLFQPVPGQDWPAFWERVREQEFGTVSLLVDGQPVPTDVAPVQESGRTLVPLRAIFEALGATVQYDEASRQVTAVKEGRRVVLWQEDHLARVDSRLRWLDVAPIARNGRTLVPVRFVSEALGADVAWLSATRTADIRRAGTRLAPLEPEAAEGRKVAYLTFDDGPSSEHTATVLDILARYGVAATFFVVGRNVDALPALARREVEEGHAIGNHSNDHNYRRIYASPEAFLQSVEQADEAILRATGRHPRLLRAPGGTAGNFTPAYFKLLHERGYSIYDWNVSTADSSWPRPSAEDILTNVAAYSYGGNVRRIIVLMHDGAGHATTVEALPGIIRYLVQQGYLLRTLEPGAPFAKLGFSSGK